MYKVWKMETNGSNGYANQMLTMLTWHDIQKKANQREKGKKSNDAEEEQEKEEAVEMLLRCSHELKLNQAFIQG